MRLARHAVPVVLATAVLFAAGCGSSNSDGYGGASQSTATSQTESQAAPPGASATSCSSTTSSISDLRVTDVGCGTGDEVSIEWSRSADCETPKGASRSSCSVRGYRCLGIAGERETSVSCAQPQRSISFLAKPR